MYEPDKVKLTLNGLDTSGHSEEVTLPRSNIALSNLWDLPKDHPDYQEESVKVSGWTTGGNYISFNLHKDSGSLQALRDNPNELFNIVKEVFNEN